MLRIVAADIDAYGRFFFERLSQVPSIREVNSIVALSEIKATTALPISGGPAEMFEGVFKEPDWRVVEQRQKLGV